MCTSILFGIFKTGCTSENRVIGISDLLIQNVTNTFLTSRNEVVQFLDVYQSIRITVGRTADIQCSFNVANRVNADVVVNQELSDQARLDLINAISQEAGWDAQLRNVEKTGFFSTPAGSQLNTVDIANYFRALTESTLTVERLNRITQSMRVDQNIEIDINGTISGELCEFTNDIMVKFFVSQALHAVLEAFQQNATNQAINVQIKEEMMRENTGPIEELFGGLSKLLMPLLIILGIGGVAIAFFFIITRNRGGSGGGSGGGSTVVIDRTSPSQNLYIPVQNEPVRQGGIGFARQIQEPVQEIVTMTQPTTVQVPQTQPMTQQVVPIQQVPVQQVPVQQINQTQPMTQQVAPIQQVPVQQVPQTQQVAPAQQVPVQQVPQIQPTTVQVPQSQIPSSQTSFGNTAVFATTIPT